MQKVQTYTEFSTLDNPRKPMPKKLPMPKINMVMTKPGHLSITCSCGLPITTTSVEFGHDCASKCAEKAYRKRKTSLAKETDKEVKRMMKLLNLKDECE